MTKEDRREIQRKLRMLQQAERLMRTLTHCRALAVRNILTT